MSFLIDPDILTLADLLMAEWPAARLRIRESGHPTCEGDPPPDPESDPDPEPTDPPEDPEDDPDKIARGDDWQTKYRKSERQRKRLADQAKRDAEERDTLRSRLSEIEASNLSETEKAIAKAREEAAAEVTSKHEVERRADRIESAVTLLSLKGFKVKDADGNDVELRFADPDDAQLRLDRALRNGDLDHADIYKDGKVDKAAVTEFLTEVLEEHPRLRADTGNGNGHKTERVDFDGGKGKGSASKSLEEMTPDDHYQAIRGKK